MTTINQLPINNTQVTPRISDLLNLLKKEIGLSFNCHAIATVQSIDTINGTLSASINYVKSYLNSDGSFKKVPYAPLVDVPFIVMQGGQCYLTFPIGVGDICEIHFNDRDIDNWFVSGTSGGPVATSRAHSIADGVAIVGMSAKGGGPFGMNYDTQRAGLSTPLGTSLKIGQDGGMNDGMVRIANSTTTLGNQIQTLLSALQTFGSAVSISATVAQIATAGNNLEIAVDPVIVALGDLLE